MISLWTAFNYLGIVIAVFFSLLILSRRRRSPANTWGWILSFFALPFLGPLFYILVGYSNITRKRRPKPRPQRRLLDSGFLMKSSMGEIDPRFSAISNLAESLSGFPPSVGNEISFFEGQENIYQALTQAIEKATRSVFLEYYIFRPDTVGTHFKELLIKKAQEGVTVKLLVDHVGSFSLSSKFIKPLLDAGVEVSFFGTLTLKRPWAFQLRNHRKLAIIDGEIVFTGSQNICSDFKLWRIRKLDWIDNQFVIQGPAVDQMETVFLEDWEFSTGHTHPIAAIEPMERKEGTTTIQILPTGPDGPSHAFEKILMALIHAANKRITLLSPYFMPTEGVVLSLEAAVRRGVQVQILVPHRSDHWLVDAASKSWYWDLLQGGIQIWETTESFIHAKQVTIDGEVALIGSANMDERSFRLNFEISLMIFNSKKVGVMEENFSNKTKQARAIEFSHFSNQHFLSRAKDGLFRLVAPLL